MRLRESAESWRGVLRGGGAEQRLLWLLHGRRGHVCWGGNTQTQRGQNKVTLSFNLTIKDRSDTEATVCRKAPEMFGSPNFPSAWPDLHFYHISLQRRDVTSWHASWVCSDRLAATDSILVLFARSVQTFLQKTLTELMSKRFINVRRLDVRNAEVRSLSQLPCCVSNRKMKSNFSAEKETKQRLG